MKSSTPFFVLAVLLFPLTLAAQTPANEVGMFASVSAFDTTERRDGATGLETEVSFDENLGYGLSYNRFWTGSLSTELAVQKLGGDVEARLLGSNIDLTVDAGEIDLTAWSGTVQWHFARRARFEPYAGAGLAYVTGELEPGVDPEDPPIFERVDLDNELTWLGNAGVNIGITDSLLAFADLKYLAYDPKGEDAGDASRIDVNPLVFAAGVKFRF